LGIWLDKGKIAALIIFVREMKKAWTVILFVGTVHGAVAQNHINSWLKAAVVWRINGRFKTEAEFHHRRQNAFGNRNMFSKNLLYLGRLWLHYQPNNNLTLSLSPFGTVVNYKVIQTKADEAQQPAKETRFTAAVAWQTAIHGKWQLQLRSIMEYRLFKNPQFHIIRLRQRLGLRYQISPQLNLGLYDEVLANITDKYTHTFYDHNRIGTVLTYQCHQRFKIDMGYIHINRRQRNTDNAWQEENISLGFTYTL
jgi:hypothetical protein